MDFSHSFIVVHEWGLTRLNVQWLKWTKNVEEFKEAIKDREYNTLLFHIGAVSVTSEEELCDLIEKLKKLKNFPKNCILFSSRGEPKVIPKGCIFIDGKKIRSIFCSNKEDEIYKNLTNLLNKCSSNE